MWKCTTATYRTHSSSSNLQDTRSLWALLMPYFHPWEADKPQFSFPHNYTFADFFKKIKTEAVKRAGNFLSGLLYWLRCWKPMGNFTGLGGSNEGIMSCLLNLSNKILIERGRFTKYYSATLPLWEWRNKHVGTIRLITCCRWNMTAVIKSSLHSIIRSTEAEARLHWFQDGVRHCAGESLLWDIQQCD